MIQYLKFYTKLIPISQFVSESATISSGSREVMGVMPLIPKNMYRKMIFQLLKGFSYFSDNALIPKNSLEPVLERQDE